MMYTLINPLQQASTVLASIASNIYNTIITIETVTCGTHFKTYVTTNDQLDHVLHEVVLQCS